MPQNDEYVYRYNLAHEFERQLDKYSENIAIAFPQGSREVTYSNYNELANQLARHLVGLGAQRNDVILASGEKTLPTFLLMLACLKAGFIYAIFDPESPVSRLQKIIGQCNPKLVFCSPESELIHERPDLFESGRVVSNFERDLLNLISVQSTSNLEETQSVHSETGAYIMFTSGSTGTPKGVLVSHASVIYFIHWARQTFRIKPYQRATNINPLYFDNSVFDYYTTLFSGGTLVPFDKSFIKEPHFLVTEIDRMQCDQIFSVPSLLVFLLAMKALDSESFGSIKRIIFGGEGFPKTKLQQIYTLYRGSVKFYNVYGPTEATCMCSAHLITDEDFFDMVNLPTLGKIAPNFDFILVNDGNENINSKSRTDVGELCLIGPCVAKGYYNDEKRSSEVFVQNPARTEYRERMYKTGDIVRYDPLTNYLHFISRKDYQVKHMGHRIELGEIEVVVNTLDYVSEAAAIFGTKNGLSCIFLIVAPNHGDDGLKIKLDLRKLLPEYMIPTKIFLLDALPKNPSGKIDRPALTRRYFGK